MIESAHDATGLAVDNSPLLRIYSFIMRTACPPFFPALIICLCGLCAATPVHAGRYEAIAGPVDVRVIEVLDGDTFVADALIWPGQRVRVRVRIRGIDAPETQAGCEAEKTAAARAQRLLSDLLIRQPVRIRNIGGGKYFGRVLADVAAGDIGDVAALMLSRDAARAYKGGKRRTFCS